MTINDDKIFEYDFDQICLIALHNIQLYWWSQI